ncbi:TPA: hypothetical protein R7C81_005396 [Klebsiella pneumoniae]|nr:hypothetical protein [Klebsiella pneumoniae]
MRDLILQLSKSSIYSTKPFIDETTRKIDLLSDQERKKADVNDADIFLMLKAFAEMGFKISLHK